VHFDVHGRLGWDFAEAIWADPSFAKLKIVALVPLRHLTEIRWLEQNGIHGVLGQPVRQIPLLQTLGTLSGRFDPPKPAPAQPAPPAQPGGDQQAGECREYNDVNECTAWYAP
jgi:hypothetical protein